MRFGALKFKTMTLFVLTDNDQSRCPVNLGVDQTQELVRRHGTLKFYSGSHTAEVRGLPIPTPQRLAMVGLGGDFERKVVQTPP